MSSKTVLSPLSTGALIHSGLSVFLQVVWMYEIVSSWKHSLKNVHTHRSTHKAHYDRRDCCVMIDVVVALWQTWLLRYDRRGCCVMTDVIVALWQTWLLRYDRRDCCVMIDVIVALWQTWLLRYDKRDCCVMTDVIVELWQTWLLRYDKRDCCVMTNVMSSRVLCPGRGQTQWNPRTKVNDKTLWNWIDCRRSEKKDFKKTHTKG